MSEPRWNCWFLAHGFYSTVDGLPSNHPGRTSANELLEPRGGSADEHGAGWGVVGSSELGDAISAAEADVLPDISDPDGLRACPPSMRLISVATYCPIGTPVWQDMRVSVLTGVGAQGATLIEQQSSKKTSSASSPVIFVAPCFY